MIFITRKIHSYQTIKIPNGLYAIQIEPTQKYPDFVLLLSRKEHVTFEEVIKIYRRSFSRSDYLGAMSLIYFKYYEEFYAFMQSILCDEVQRKKYQKANRKFYYRYLKRWNEFVQRSDDVLFPQNIVIKKLYQILKETYGYRK